jgi:ribosomal protein S2
LSGIALKDLLEAGVHFGHQTKRWNPKMKQYIFGERNGIYIIDLAKTARLFREAEQFAANLAADGRTILFVGTKRQAQDAIAEEAQRCGMFHVNQRWLGGLLTNFTTIQRSLGRLRDLEAMETDGRYDSLSKKEISQLEKEKRKLQKNLDGIRHMSRLPDALFVVDTRKEKIAVDEARKLKIPVIGIVDTNCDPDEVDLRDPGQRRRAAGDPAVRLAHRRRRARRPRHPRVGAGRGERRARRGRPRAARPPAPGAPRGHDPGFRVTPGPRPDRLIPTPAVHHGPAFPCTALRSKSAGDSSDGRDHGGNGEAAPRRDRRGHDGVQEGADRGQRQTSRRPRPSCARPVSRRPPRRRAARPTRGSSGTTSTWAAGSACSSR